MRYDILVSHEVSGETALVSFDVNGGLFPDSSNIRAIVGEAFVRLSRLPSLPAPEHVADCVSAAATRQGFAPLVTLGGDPHSYRKGGAEIAIKQGNAKYLVDFRDLFDE